MKPKMKYDPIREERKWYEIGETPHKPLPPKHNFAHNCVRAKLCDTLVELGARDNSFILEVGCGSGEDAIYVQRVSKRIVGVDVSPIALRSFGNKGFQGAMADVGILPFKDSCFDYVLSSGLLHHLVGQGNLKDYLIEFARVTKDDGYLIALEPNSFNISGILTNVFNTIKPGITGLVPHERALSPLLLINTFKVAGWEDVRCVSASYVWNRFPLSISKFISTHEDAIRFRKPFNLFGWFVIIYGKKRTDGANENPPGV